MTRESMQAMSRQEILAHLALPAQGDPLRVFCAGIGGTGLSALARLSHALGHRVSGSDRRPSAATASLEQLGIDIRYRQTAVNVTAETDLVVATAALPAEHPELTRARELGVPVVKYAEALGAFVAARRGIALAGTHGKTTTTAMTAHVMRCCGADPSWIVGGNPQDLPANAGLGTGEELVFEACEFDRSFDNYTPAVAAFLNIEVDHPDCYDDLAEIESAFVDFGLGMREGGTLLACADWPAALRAAEKAQSQRPDLSLLTFALDKPATYRAHNVRLERGLGRFDLVVAGEPLGEVQLQVPGRHNVANALAAIAASAQAGIDPCQAARAVERFHGVRRRYDLLRERGDVIVVDDYAHHPTAIATVVEATRSRYPDRRIVTIFEPHQASRTRALFDDFARALANSDRVVLARIYACRDTPEDLASVSSAELASTINMLDPRTEALAVGGPDEVLQAALDVLKAGDVALFLGAGPISTVAHQVAKQLPPSPSSGLRKRITSASFPRVKPLEDTLAAELGDLVKFDAPLGSHCTFKAGGRARFFSAPRSEAEAIFVVRAYQKHGIPIVPLGGGSNSLFVSERLDAAVVLTRHLKGIRVLGNTLRCSAGTGLQGVIRAAERANLAGLEEFAGIPGTLGGAIFGNAGGPPGKPTVGHRVARVRLLEPGGKVRWCGPERLGLSYRHSELTGAFVLACDLHLTPGDGAELRARRLEITARKSRVQPVDARSAGCTFRNPPGDSAGRLIDELGLKGLTIGGATVSTVHGNFIVNQGGARPADIVALMDEVRRRVHEATGLDLRTEVRLIA